MFAANVALNPPNALALNGLTVDPMPLVVSSSTFYNNSNVGNPAFGNYDISASAVTATVDNSLFWTLGQDYLPIVPIATGVFTWRHNNLAGSGGSGAGWLATLGTDGGGNVDGDPVCG